ncbi:MAG: hypothetical protein IK997_06140 [Bacilli bacterium]|nr:hypothetical protein [Bacilli bacterium]
MSKLPRIFHNDISKNISNNKEYAYLSNNTNFERKSNPLEFINSLFREEGFIFNKPLIIKTRTGTFDTAIVKKENDYIYTLSDDIININDIISIERKN